MMEPFVVELLVAWSVAFVFLALSSWLALRVDALRRSLAVSAESLSWHEAQLERTLAALDEARSRRREDAALVGRVYGDLGDERVAHRKTEALLAAARVDQLEHEARYRQATDYAQRYRDLNREHDSLRARNTDLSEAHDKALADLVELRVQLAEHETRLYSDEFRDALSADLARRIGVRFEVRAVVDDPVAAEKMADDQRPADEDDPDDWPEATPAARTPL
jgi:nitrogen fixation/metabolism regulation signal transduction histidine kinase